MKKISIEEFAKRSNVAVEVLREAAFDDGDICYIPISDYTLGLMQEYAKKVFQKEDPTPLEVSDMIELACHRWLDREGFSEEQ